jgi:hypothetical protein
MQGSAALYDAMVASAVHLKNNPRLDKKVLLVITDGQENMSQETLEEAARRLQQGNAQLFMQSVSWAGICAIRAVRLCKDWLMGRAGWRFSRKAWMRWTRLLAPWLTISAANTPLRSSPTIRIRNRNSNR